MQLRGKYPQGIQQVQDLNIIPPIEHILPLTVIRELVQGPHIITAGFLTEQIQWKTRTADSLIPAGQTVI